VRNARGFTLLELLIVVAIIAALSAAFPLALNRFLPARRVDSAARTLVADLHLAQTRSIATGKPVSLAISPSGYQIERDDVRELNATTTLELRTADDALAVNELKVFPDGSTTGGRFRIRDGTRMRLILVSALTGRVSLGNAT
jgi:general secretion pathway protein H